MGQNPKRRGGASGQSWGSQPGQLGGHCATQESPHCHLGRKSRRQAGPLWASAALGPFGSGPREAAAHSSPVRLPPRRGSSSVHAEQAFLEASGAHTPSKAQGAGPETRHQVQCGRL